MRNDINNYVTSINSLIELPLRRTLVRPVILFSITPQFICHPERSEGHHSPIDHSQS
jgi:hypothetical protein